MKCWCSRVTALTTIEYVNPSGAIEPGSRCGVEAFTHAFRRRSSRGSFGGQSRGSSGPEARMSLSRFVSRRADASVGWR